MEIKKPTFPIFYSVQYSRSSVTITEIGTVPKELPPARLYFDDLEEIVSIFRECVAIADDHGICVARANYVIGRFECTELEELKKFGERTSKMEIRIQGADGPLGYLSIGPTTFWAAASKHGANSFQIYGRLNSLFELRKIKWKAALRAIPTWILFVFFLITVLPELVVMFTVLRPAHLLANLKSSIFSAVLYLGTAWALTGWLVYRLVFAPTTIEFRRVHDPQGFRKRWAEWKPYVIAAVIGGGITKLLDFVASWIKK